MTDVDRPGSLLLETVRLLQSDKRDLLLIHKETSLPFYWLRKLKAGKFKNPSVNRIQRLYEHYHNRPLLG